MSTINLTKSNSKTDLLDNADNDENASEPKRAGDFKRGYKANQYESQMTMMEMEPHELSIFSVIAHFNTSAQEGLNSAQILKNRGEGGSNVLSLSSGTCCPCSGSASHALPPTTKVTRDGKVAILSTKDLVKGDLVHITKNIRVGADLRLIKASDIKVDNDILGSVEGPVARNADADVVHKSFLEITNMLYAGSLVTSGTGQGIVVNIGLQTKLGEKLLAENNSDGSCSVM